MDNIHIYKVVHTKEFLTKWRQFLQDIYNYRFYEEYVIIPTLFGKDLYSYMPLLNYTDIFSGNESDLLESSEGKLYQIRMLNTEYKSFTANDTVDMRVDISSSNLDFIFNNVFTSRKCRNQIRKAEKSGVISKSSNDKKFINDFYTLYKKNMLNHGTPMFGIDFFYKLNQHIECDFIVTYMDKTPMSSVVIIYDDKLSLAMWSGIDSNYLGYCPNHSMYWKAIELAIHKEKIIFDFGRSAYDSYTYRFKKQWGAKPIKIDIIKPNMDNIYKKYKFASTLWKKLPVGVSEYFGPKLCKYLGDL